MGKPREKEDKEVAALKEAEGKTAFAEAADGEANDRDPKTPPRTAATKEAVQQELGPKPGKVSNGGPKTPPKIAATEDPPRQELG
ncbi:hypothetical protein AC578_10575 [Pseudocercospora eumusae]|uniref:Uncharacterized protein n=1 Tax=Pseudocercospora eumusae TaxID=321146 RepID=A0A139H5F2_9PEZI|nr:hypothetical protein AC578_10575 [Pseudocercospora eumusae]